MMNPYSSFISSLNSASSPSYLLSALITLQAPFSRLNLFFTRDAAFGAGRHGSTWSMSTNA